jgi:thiol-disulfide isomerase/thioredoxin
LPSLGGATEWINSPPLMAAGLRGKVVLIDFWTYTCINWLRTLPYVRAWAAKYKDHGLGVIGVHSPEFEFEKDIANVRRAVKSLRVDYPVAVDSDHAVWRAFKNDSARANTKRRRESFNNCCSRPVSAESAASWCRSTAVVWKRRPIGVT